jgi:Type III restriction enzyme, res subunit
VSSVKLARFQEAAVNHIVDRLRDHKSSQRMLLADEVGLGKTHVAQGVIQALLKGRRRPLTVIYLCSNAEIAEQNRKKLDPDSRKPIGRVTELAVDRPDSEADLLLYSFTPGTSLREGTGLAWERRLLLYLLHRINDCPVGTRSWREFFRCGAGEENWYSDTTLTALGWDFERKTSTTFSAGGIGGGLACRQTRTGAGDSLAQGDGPYV